MVRDLGQPTDAAYQAAKLASDKILTTAPQSVAGYLKIAFAAVIAVSAGSGLANPIRQKEGIEAAEMVLRQKPDNPYATDLLANIMLFSASTELAAGQDPWPIINRAIALLEPVIIKNPTFLWGLNDLGALYINLGYREQVTGKSTARDNIEKALKYVAKAADLDPTYPNAPPGAIYGLSFLIGDLRSKDEVILSLVKADTWFSRCISVNRRNYQCFNNYGQVYARAAYRGHKAGLDVRVWLQRAVENLTIAQKQNAGLDAEQGAAQAHIVEASVLVQSKQDAGPALSAVKEDLARCFRVAAQDATCRAHAVEAEWLAADALAGQGKPFVAVLQGALEKARLAAESPEKLPEARWVLAESHLRLARAFAPPRVAGPADSRLRDAHIGDGLTAAGQVFAINPNHAQGLATQGALYLLRAQTTIERAAQTQAAQAAAQVLERALQRDPLLSHRYAPLLAQARSLGASP